MTAPNKKNLDYTLAYLRFLAGFRASPPAALKYGLTPEQAEEKRNMVDACLNRGTQWATVSQGPEPE